MKIWYNFGSEHSMNLVIIGTFKETTDLSGIKDIFDQISFQVRQDIENGIIKIGEETTDKYSEEMLNYLSETNIGSITPWDLEDFAYDFDITLEKDKIVLTTEEANISSFIKILIEKGAKLEIFSAHNYPNSGYGRNTSNP